MDLQIAGLISQHRICRRMGLVECVFREAYHLVEDLLCGIFRHTVSHTSCDLHIAVIIGLAMDKVLFFLQHNVHLFLTHGTAHQVGTSIGITAQIAHDLHDLLLIHQTAIGNR